MIRFIKNEPGFGLLGILIVIVVITALTGGDLYFREYVQQNSLQRIGIEAEKRAEELRAKTEKQQKEVQKNLEQNTPLPAQAIDTSNWKTYRNEKYGFEVKYPKEWNDVPTELNVGMGVESFVLNPLQINLQLSGGRFWDVVTVLMNTGYSIGQAESKVSRSDIDESINEFKKSVNHFMQESVNIGGISAVRISGLSTNPYRKNVQQAEIYVIKNNVLYTFEYDGIGGDFEKEFDAIFSTFKFIK